MLTLTIAKLFHLGYCRESRAIETVRALLLQLVDIRRFDEQFVQINLKRCQFTHNDLFDLKN